MSAPASPAAIRALFHLPAGLALSIALLGGFALALQAHINSELAARLNDGVTAALISFATGFALMVVVGVALPGSRAGLRRIPDAWRERRYPRWYLLGAISGAYYIFTQAQTIGLIGIAVFTIAVVTGQMLSGLVVDRLGFGTGQRRRITPVRGIGAVLALAASTIAVLPHLQGSARIGALLVLVLLPFVAGLLQSVQQAMLGKLASAHGTPIVSTLLNFGVGTAVLLAIWALRAPALPALVLPPEWWLYLGGPIGCLALVATTLAVTSIGVLLTGLAIIGGQLLGSLALDIIVPAAGTIVGPATLAAVAMTLAAIAVASLPWRRTPKAPDL